MSQIIKFDYPDFDSVKSHHHGVDWPVVYVLQGGREVYVGETISAVKRSKEHLKNIERKRMNTMYMISDDSFNKSAILDIESWLIQYMIADQKFDLQNKNGGLKNHSYYNRELYTSKFEIIWKKLQKIGLANRGLVELKNSDLFKYSPYKSLSYDQLEIAETITNDVSNSEGKSFLVTGKPGTGKTILAIYLVKSLLENKKTNHLQIGLVVPMTSLRGTLKKVFQHIKGLKSSMIIGPGDVVKKQYDILLVDEAHRLQRRKAITNYGSFDNTNAKLGLGNDGTHLDRILKSSKHQIFFYDKNQSIRPSDIPFEYRDRLDANRLSLSSQLRVQGGAEYIQFVNDVFDIKTKESYNISNYDVKLYDDIKDLYASIQEKNENYGLCRLVAGFAWDRVSNKPELEKEYDIEIDGFKLKRNNVTKNWVNSNGAEKEVGCIHTIQGYDLNYVGVIIGNEIGFDSMHKKFTINKDNYKDTKGKSGLDEDELKGYILNIYKTLLTRGILGTYIYIVNPDLKEYMREIIDRMKVDGLT